MIMIAVVIKNYWIKNIENKRYIIYRIINLSLNLESRFKI